ncbi:MAG: SDR family NAD(P)-dependent oxidoreductase [Negativicutes bacterium]
MNFQTPFNFVDKVVLITGAAGTIGRDVAKGFAQCGANVVVADLRQDAAIAVLEYIKQYHGDHLAITVDVTAVKSIEAMVFKAVEKYGKIDFLINHAGINNRKNIVDYTEEDWDQMCGINLKGVFFVGQAVGKQMLAQKYGKIVNTASVSAIRAKKKLSIYAATKGGVIQLTKAMAHEWANYGINVNAIGPGYVRSNQTESLFQDKVKYEELIGRIPQGRFGETEDIVATMLFLCSDLAAYINGQTIYVEGGRLVD